MKLFRPIGVREYLLIKETQYSKFPPRLEWQPIFYPVLNQKYAEQICFEWNTNDEFSGYCGLVTQFEVNNDYISKFKVENVGGMSHNELWIPAEELEEFNRNIISEIKVVNAYFGSDFQLEENKELKEYYKKYKL